MNSRNEVATETTAGSCSAVSPTGSIIQEIPNWAKFYDGVNFKLVPLYGYNKKAKTYWKDREGEEVSEFNWNGVTGLAAIMGVESGFLAVADFDKVSDWNLVRDVLQASGLPPDYKWVYYTGSQQGFQVAFRTFDGESVDAFQAIDKTRFNHGELRWSGCLSTIPPTQTDTGEYAFVNGPPVYSEPPTDIPTYKVEAAIALFATLPEKFERPENEHSVAIATPQVIQDVEFLLAKCADHYEYPDWRQLCFSVISILGDQAKLVIESRYETKDNEIDRMIESHKKNTKRNEVTVKTLIYRAKENGWNFNWSEIPGLAEIFRAKEAPVVKTSPVATMPDSKVAKKKTIRLWDSEELANADFPEVPDLLEGVMPAEGVFQFAGEDKAGKSIFAKNLALTVASDRDTFLCWNVKLHGPVLYVNNELSDRQMQRRLKKMRIPLRHEVKFINDLDLRFDRDIELILNTIKELKPVLVIVDCHYRATREDKDYGNAIQQVLENYARIKTECNTLVFVIHHLKKSAKASGTYASSANAMGSLTFAMGTDGNLEFRKSHTDTDARLVLDTGLRESKDFHPQQVRLNADTLWFEYEGETTEEEHMKTDKETGTKENYAVTILQGIKYGGMQHAQLVVWIMDRYKVKTAMAHRHIQAAKKLGLISESPFGAVSLVSPAKTPAVGLEEANPAPTPSGKVDLGNELPVPDCGIPET